MAAVAPVPPPNEIPAALKEKVDTLHNSVQVLFVSKQIPWIIQAKMAEDGYVTMEDLACRWVSAEKAWEEGPKDLQFRDGEKGFDKSNSDFSAMRLYQAVVQARSLLHSGKASSLSDGVTRPTTGFNLDALCDRVALEKDWVNQTGQPKPRLEYQGSDSFLKKQFRYCAKGEIGYFAHWLFLNFNSSISPSQTWMNGMIGSMGPPSQGGDHHLRSSHSCGLREMPGGKFTSSWQMAPLWRLQWRPSRKTNFSGPGRSTNGCSSSSWRRREIPKAKARVRTREERRQDQGRLPRPPEEQPRQG